jgi:hypothetical protein
MVGKRRSIWAVECCIALSRSVHDGFAPTSDKCAVALLIPSAHLAGAYVWADPEAGLNDDTDIWVAAGVLSGSYDTSSSPSETENPHPIVESNLA